MSKKKYRRKSSNSNPIIPMAVGLLMIVLAFAIMSSSGPGRDDDSLSSVVPVPVHFAAPELLLENISGQTESLTDYRDRVVLVNNWATWCPPCKAEMPTLSAYFMEHSTEGFTIIAIEAGDPGHVVAPFVQSYNLEFPVWLDPNRDSLQAFGNGTLPNSYVIDRSGTVRYAWTGEISKAMLEKYVTLLLKDDG